MEQIFNNGHTIEIEAGGHNVLVLGGVDRLQQFHFHRLVSTPLPARRRHGPSRSHERRRRDAVVGVLMVRGASSGALAPIFAQADDLEVKPPCLQPPALPANRGYFRYEGSLLPCPKECIGWFSRINYRIGEDLAQFHERSLQRPVQRFLASGTEGRADPDESGPGRHDDPGPRQHILPSR
jgi:carbonic anhydrase